MAKCKTRCNCKCDYYAKNFEQFTYFTANPQRYNVNPIVLSESLLNPTIVAELELCNLEKCNKVVLDGLFHITNTTPSEESPNEIIVLVRIFKDSIEPENLIYRSRIEVDSRGDDNIGQPIPVLDVIEIENETASVRYILTAAIANVTPDGTGEVRRPITFTATVYK